jgi:hypothetical protein
MARRIRWDKIDKEEYQSKINSKITNCEINFTNNIEESVNTITNIPVSGADPGFQVRGGTKFKKLRRAEGGAKVFGVFRVKNHDFTPKNHIFSNFRGARAGCALPPLDPPLGIRTISS